MNLNAIYTQNEENISNVQKEKDLKYFIKATNVVDFKEDLESNFTEDFIRDICSKIDNEHVSIDSIMSRINDKLKNAGTNYAHLKRATKEDRNPKWFDNECSKLKADKYRLLRKYRKTRRDEDLENYLSAKNLFKNTCSTKADEMARNNLNDLTSSIGDSKSFWTKLRNLTNKNKPIKNNISTEDWVRHFENLLNNSSDENDNLTINRSPDIDISEVENYIFNSEISEDEVRQSILHMKKGKSPGSDNFIPEFFIYGIDTLCPILVRLFNRLFSNGEYPLEWCNSIIITLHKKVM